MNIVSGLDIGNGYLKGRFQGTKKTPFNVDIPSCAVQIVSTPIVPDDPDSEYMREIFDRMICIFDSPLVKNTNRFMFGRGAIASGRSLIEFDIADTNLSKAEQQLSSLLVLASVAGAALKNYWDQYKKLPSSVIKANVKTALALPIDEYMKCKAEFSSKFKASEHEVTICNFDQPVHIKVVFDAVHILPEGVSAQYAIMAKGEAFAKALLDDVRKTNKKALKGIGPKDIINCRNTCGIDIGEGTVNFPVITDGRFNMMLSTSIQRGYGTVLEQALPAIQKQNMPYDSRKAVADFMQTEETAFNKRRKATIKDIVDAEAADLVNEIGKEISRILRSGTVEVIYVYGGGATPLKDVLYTRLMEKTKTFAGEDEFPILYLDSSYARNLNREGLYQMALKKE